MARAYTERDRDLLELYHGLNLAMDLHAQWWLPGWARDACWRARRKYEDHIHAWLCAGAGCDAETRSACPFECCVRRGRPVNPRRKEYGTSKFGAEMRETILSQMFDAPLLESAAETMERLGLKAEPGTPKELTGADYRALMEKAGLTRPVEIVGMPPATPETFRAGKEHLERLSDAHWRRMGEQMDRTLNKRRG